MTTRSELLLTLTGPLSHHDPAVTDGSNMLLFNRATQLHARTRDTAPSTQTEIDRICHTHTVPGDLAPLLQDLSYPEFIAIALIRFFIYAYGAGEGAGIFTGKERYARLHQRVRTAAVRAVSLRQWWNRLTADMHVLIHKGDDDADLFSLLSVASGTQEAVLRAMLTESDTSVALARYWNDLTKKQSARYAEKAGAEQSAASTRLVWDATKFEHEMAPIINIELPAVQGGSVRHQCVRAPAWMHLTQTLGLKAAFAGEGDLPAGVEAIFENGGNIAGGSKQTGNPHAHSTAIRRAFPSLDLLGGCTDSFDLGESKLKLAVWLVCKENAAALDDWAASLDNAKTSAYDMLTEVTQTRQASSRGLGQMIYNCEALAAGAQVLVRFTLDYSTSDLTKGAFVAALDTYLEHPILGGQSRAGFGCAEGRWLSNFDGAADSRRAYEEYLAENREKLLEGMRSGTLCSTAVVVS